MENTVYVGWIPIEVIEHLDKLHLNLSHYWSLIGLYNRELDTIPPAILATLERKDYVLNGSLTNMGTTLVKKLLDVDSLSSVSDIKKELKKAKSEYDSKFLQWWKAYPAGNTWRDDAQHGNKLYVGNRGFRTKESECEKLYLKALTEYTQEEMLGAVEYEVMQKKIESRRLSENKLTYMVNTHTYLLNRLYVNFIEMMKIEGFKTGDKTKPGNTTFQTMLV